MGGDARIAVVGVGIVSTAGRGVDRTLAALRTGGVAPSPPRLLSSDLPAHPPVFEVPSAAFDDPPLRLPGGRGRRGVRLALLAGFDALAAHLHAIAPDRFGVVVGATVGGMNHTEDWVEERALAAAPRVAARAALRHLPLWEVPNVLAARFGAQGPAMAVATACTSGSQAIAVGADLIRAGICDAVLAGGVDCLARVTYHGFASLGLLDTVRCRPFDPGRAGLNLGEGAAFVLLARAGTAGPPLAWLDGWASTSDAHHATAPRPDGSGLAAAIHEALGRAGADPRSVDWVHAHGTATRNNDDVEAEAIASIFGAGRVPVSSTKHVFGHTLGAAGAISAVVATLAIRESFRPGNSAVSGPGPGSAIALVPPDGVRAPVRRVVVNSLGFGGTNCALVLSGAST